MRLSLHPTVSYPWRWALTFLFSLIIAALSMFSPPFVAGITPNGVDSLPQADKVAHALFYAILTGLTIWALASSPSPVSRRRFYFLAGAATAYGLLMEWLQGFTVTRSCDLFDGLANAVGAFLTAEFGFRWIRRRGRRGGRSRVEWGGTSFVRRLRRFPQIERGWVDPP